MNGKSVVGFLATLIGLAASTAIHGQTAGDFYKTNPIHVIVGNGAGGDYDTMARLVSQNLSRHIPGNPSIVVQNMPGANGVIAANYLYNIAPKDGSVMGTLSRQIPTLDALARGALQADTQKFGWIGGLGEPNRVCFTSSHSTIKTAKDLLGQELIVGATAASAGPSVTPNLLNKVLGTKFRIVDGYRDTPEVIMAVKRGEVQGFCHTWALFKTQHADMLKDGSVKPLIYMEESKFEDIPDLPSVYDLANDDQKESLRFYFSSADFGVPFVLPPGVPPDRLKILRDAFVAMLSDPQFIAQAKQWDRDVTFHTPDQLLTLVKQLKAISPEKLKDLEKILPANFN